LVLIVLDGWGHSDRAEGNAIAASRPRFLRSLRDAFPSGLLEASGEAVGLPPGFIGNSEVGHLCLGAGRTVLQDLARIDASIRTGEFDANPVLCDAMDRAAAPGRALHLIGLLSDGGVHSHVGHLEALVALARARRVASLYLHPFLDGRDTPPRSAAAYLRRLDGFLRSAGIGTVATVAGRYYAMDRDNRWERTEKAHRALVLRDAPRFPTALQALESAYAAGVGDEFVPPAVIEAADASAPEAGGEAPGAGAAGAAAPPARRDARVRDGDAVLFFNFRADRARQLTRAFTEPDFDRVRLAARPALGVFVCFTSYDRSWTLPVAFPPRHLSGTFGEAVSRAGLRQLRIAETEKYAHVTYFFNGGEERVFPGEERHLVPSPRVATYDLVPEMSASAVTAETVRRLQEQPRQVVILNFANADMVGHTGRFEAAVEACRVVDRSVEQVTRETLRLGGVVLVTADHGNAEEMIDPRTGGPLTAHTVNPVPVHVAGAGLEGRRLRPLGRLADVAPTMLRLLDLKAPDEMEGRSLFEG
jgi:2,3-bisphosphoglycerate-independent phosphoglycerate mutase